MLILSRKNEDQLQLDRLREILEAATDGAISYGGDIEPGDTLPELITQVDNTVVEYMKAFDGLEYAYENLQLEAATLATQCAMQENTLESFMDVRYDDALDDAVTDLMDVFLGSGAATSTFDGDISFDESVTFTKQDLKPLLRQAIMTWVSTKVR